MVKESVTDGLGYRLVIFAQGCPRECPGCQNPDLIPVSGGKEMTGAQVLQLIKDHTTPLISGITFSGGDPLMQPEELVQVLQLIRLEYPRYSIWVYTGYFFEEVCDLPALGFIDVLVDGPYEAARRDLGLPFRGSDNQRLINVPASLKSGSLKCLEF